MSIDSFRHKTGRLHARILVSFAFAATGALLPAQAVNEATPDETPVVLQKFEVKAASRKDDYIASEATTGTRTAAKIIEVPYAVQVITPEFISDFQLFDASQQLAFVSAYGVGASPDRGVLDNNRLRGFQPLVMRDGFSLAGPADLSNIAQLEIIKGPQATLYGQSNPGGLINYVSKRPKLKPSANFTAILGDSYDFQRFQAEATGPVYKDKLYYLASFSYQYTDSTMDYVYMRRRVGGMTLMWKPTPNTSITAYWESQRINQNRGNNIPLLITGSTVGSPNPLRRVGGVAQGPALELQNFNTDGPYDPLIRNYDGANLLVDHKISTNWGLRFSAQGFVKDFSEDHWAAANFDAITQRYNGLQPTRQLQEISALAFHADLLGQYRLGKVKNALLIGLDYYDEETHDETKTLTAAQINALPDSRRFMDPKHPDFGPFDYDSLSVYSVNQDVAPRSNAVLINDRAFFFNDRLIVSASGRYAAVKTKAKTPAASANGTEDAVTYSVGANYKIKGDAFTVFANYGTSFNTLIAIDRGTGEVQKPETGLGYEAGFKGLFFSEKYGYTVSAYDILKDNIPISNPDFTGPGAGIPQFIGQGEQHVKGVDIELSARITPALTVIANGSYLDSELQKAPATPANVGQPLLVVPAKTFSGAIRYSFLNGSLKGLRLGLSMSYQDDYLVTYATATRVRESRPANQLYNAVISYGWRQGKYTHMVALNGSNIFDRWYLTAEPRVGRGREVRASYSLSF